MKTTLFVLGVSTISVLVLVAVVSIVSPNHRLWPVSERNWKFWLTWTLWPVSMVTALGVGVLDRGSFVLPTSISLIVGGGIFVGGILIALESILELGLDETEGMDGDLRTGGLYRYSRNPQYVGDTIMTVGFVLLTNSRLVIFLGTLHLAYYVLLPLAEEPWLQEEYGENYREYREAVPRFVGMRTFERVLSDLRSDSERKLHE